MTPRPHERAIDKNTAELVVPGVDEKVVQLNLYAAVDGELKGGE
jgi:hypothetical protein